MTTPQGIGEPIEPLTYKTWVLKVSIHCQGCKRKVNKVLHSVEGVYTINIDAKQQKVIVTGNVEPETLIRKLIKSGRHAELWPETPDPEQTDKKPRKSKKKVKDNDADSTSEEEEDDDDINEIYNNATDIEKHTVKVEAIQDPSGKVYNANGGGGVVVMTQSAGNPTTVMIENGAHNVNGSTNGNGSTAEKTGSGSKRKKKKKKGHKSVTVVEPSSGGAPPNNIFSSQEPHYAGPPPGNLSPPRHYGHQYPPHYHAPPPVYTVSHNTTYPTTGYTTSYYATPPPTSYPNVSHMAPYCPSPPRSSYGYAYSGPEVESPLSDFESYPRQRPNSFEIFSEENPNGCSIM